MTANRMMATVALGLAVACGGGGGGGGITRDQYIAECQRAGTDPDCGTPDPVLCGSNYDMYIAPYNTVCAAEFGAVLRCQQALVDICPSDGSRTCGDQNTAAGACVVAHSSDAGSP